MSPSEWVIAAGFVVIALLAWYGIRKTDPKLAPRIPSERAVNYDLASGKYVHPRQHEAVVPQAGMRRG